MPTEAELQAEFWWGREIVTAETKWLGTQLCLRTGRPPQAFGTKGDRFHLNGSHRSQEWIENSRFCTSRTYTVQAGLTEEQLRHIAGIDFTPGSVEQMIAQSKRIYAAMRAGQLNGVREFYGNINGDRIVDGWDNLRDRPVTSDDSHLWHWHLGCDRRRMQDMTLMKRILATALGDDQEEDDVTAEQNWEYPIRNPKTGNTETAEWRLLDTERNTSAILKEIAEVQATLRVIAGSDPAEAVRAEMAKLAPMFASIVAEELGDVEVDEDALAAALLRRFAAASPES